MVRAVPTLLALVLLVCCGDPAEGPADAGVDAPPPGLQIFDTSKLHRIAIEVAPMYLGPLDDDPTMRVPCTFTFDGTVVANAGIRKKGGLGSVTSLSGKTGFSVKLNEFVPGQRLDGLEKLLLNNAQEDPTFVSEHTGYEAHRRMGGVAPYTSHATVTFNGDDYGLFVVKEPVAEDFLERAFGPDRDGGNLYEGYYHQEDQSLGDFVTHPEQLELKDEDQGRTRDDMIAFASAVRTTPNAGFEAAVRAHLDLDPYLTALAVDTVVGYWDSYAYFLNNYYFYRDPGSGRFRYIPHGMDQLEYQEPGQPMGQLARRIRAIPALDAALDAEIARVRSTWDVAAMTARIDEVERILATAPTGGRTEDDVQSFRDHAGDVRAAVAAIPR